MKTSEKSTVRDLTTGRPWKLILGFAFPLLLGMLFQQFYSMVDTIVVGRFLGAKALAAVGSTGSLNFMIVGFCMGICNGFAIPVAHKFGENNEKALRIYVANGAILAAVFAFAVSGTVCVVCHQILNWMNTPADIMAGAYSYIFIIFLGIPFTVLYNQTSAVMRSLGDSRSPLIFLGISSFLNIILDLLLVIPLGVAGTAVATITAQGISGLLCLFYMKKNFPILHFEKDDWKLRKNYVKNLCNMGIPMGLQYSITAIGSVLLQTAVNGLGSLAVASVTASSKLCIFFNCPFDALGSTMATYAGQNVGARKLDRVSQGLKSSALMGALYSLAAFGILYLASNQLFLLFVSASETVILHQARRMLLTNALFYIPLTFVNVVRFTIQGMGFSKFAVLAGVCEMAARSFVAFALVPSFGFSAVCFANPAAWVCADLFLIPAFFFCRKHLQRQFANT